MVAVAVLAGGPSAEHEVSLQTGAEILAQLRAAGVASRPVRLSRENTWAFGGRDDDFESLARAGGLPLPGALDALGASREVAFLGLHGRFGEDGQIQRLLEQRGIPFTGSGSRASGIGMDKLLSKQAAASVGARCAAQEIVRAGTAAAERLRRTVGWPCVVKPVRGGSSVGVSRVDRDEELPGAVRRAAEQDDEGCVLVEPWLDGVEVTCGVLRVLGAVRTLPLIAIRPSGGGFYDFHAKYQAEDTRFECPAPVGRDATAEVERVSRELYAALELRGVARLDFIVERESGQPCFLELNTLPGFTSHSLVPRAAAAAGYSRLDVLRTVLADAGAST